MPTPYAQQRIRALAWEARRRGISYGILCTQLQLGEDEEILLRYAQEKGISLRFLAGQKGQSKLNWDGAQALYDQGLSDRQIGLRLGRSASSVGSWRHRQGLPPNQRKGGGAANECG